MKKIAIILLLFLPIISIGQLPTSNLKLSAIIDTLNDISATSLSDVSLSDNVNKYGLNSVYCPGTDADARLSNLRADKIMSYFKAYKHSPHACDFYITSGGYSPDTVLYQIKLNAVEGVFRLNYQAYSVKDYFDLYDGESIIDGTGGLISGGSDKTPSDGGQAGITYDGEYNWPLWYYHDGSSEDTIYIRTYAPETNTGWKFFGKCPSIATEGTDYTSDNGMALYYSNLTTPFNVSITPASDSVYVKAYSVIDNVKVFEKSFDSQTTYQSGYGSFTKFVFIIYSRNNTGCTINVTD
jgi:hypothetical protein